MNIEALIAKRLAAKKSFKVVSTFANGETYTHMTETMGQAEVHKSARSQAIGKRVATGNGTVSKLVCVVVEAA
jgi:hypothetical protein